MAANPATHWFDPLGARVAGLQEPGAADLASRMPRVLAKAREIAGSLVHGAHGRRRAGVGETFWQYRPFADGESAQRIDWRRSARGDQLFVREREWEAAQNYFVWVNLSPSMAFKSQLAADYKIDRAAALSLAAAEVLVKSGERVGALGLTAPLATRGIIERLGHVLAEQPAARRAQNIPPAAPLPPRAKLILISDFLCDLGELSARLRDYAGAGARGALLMLLDPAEESLFERLSVFASGFTLDAAEAVGAGGMLDTADVLDSLTALVEKSLVELYAGGERYRMLETVRQYAQEKLEASDGAVAVRTRHLEFFLALAEKVQPELWGPEQGKWLTRLDLERENFLSAHAWCDHMESGAERGLRLVYALQLYWLPRGLIELGYRVTMEALARPGAQTRDLHRSGALYAAGQLAFFMGAYPESKRRIEECLRIAHEFGIKAREAAAHLMLGYACEALGESAAALTNFEASAALARELGDKGRLAFALNALAGLHQEARDLDAAVPLFEEALSLTRELDDQERVSIHLSNLARALIDRGTDERARGLLIEGLTIAREIGSTRGGGYVVEITAGLAALHGEWEPAARFYGAVQARFAEIGLRRTPADDAFLESQVAKAREALGDQAFATAETAGRALPYEEVQDEVRSWLEQKEANPPTPQSPAIETPRPAKNG